MTSIIAFLLMVPLNSVLSHVAEVDDDSLMKRVTDCFFIDNDIEKVELVCDNNSENYAKTTVTLRFSHQYHKKSIDRK